MQIRGNVLGQTFLHKLDFQVISLPSKILCFNSTNIHEFLVHLDRSRSGWDVLFFETCDTWESYLMSLSMPKSYGQIKADFLLKFFLKLPDLCLDVLTSQLFLNFLESQIILKVLKMLGFGINQVKGLGDKDFLEATNFSEQFNRSLIKGFTPTWTKPM